MPGADVHFEPYLHLAGVGDDEALIAWGGFFFTRDDAGGTWRLADDSRLPEITGGTRTDSIGARSLPYGHAVVEVRRDGEVVAREATDAANHVWVRGLEPDTAYEYRVVVDGEPWAEGERWDWDPDGVTLRPQGRRYDNRFRTFPARATAAPVRFAVLGDFGIGVLRRTDDSDRQRHLAHALERAATARDVRFVLTVGDNVYLGTEGTVSGTGDEDDDWFGSFYQPYRYLLNRLAFFPAVGNHDAAETERADDRGQLYDNYFVDERFRPGVESRRASLDPGLFYRVGIGGLLELVCLDTSLAEAHDVHHFFDDPGHRAWVREALERAEDGAARWRIPFSHHPPFCAGPHHGNTETMVEQLVPLFHEAGVRLVLSGHEHNFQHAIVDGIDYVVSGAAGKLRPGRPEPEGWQAAGTRAWAADGHFLLVDVEADRIVVQPVCDVAEDGTPTPIALEGPDGEPVETPIVVR